MVVESDANELVIPRLVKRAKHNIVGLGKVGASVPALDSLLRLNGEDVRTDLAAHEWCCVVEVVA